MSLRKLREDEVEFTLEVEQEDIPVRGNLVDSGDPEADKHYEDEILKRLDEGDVWAWALVTVRAKWNGFEGSDNLGGCTYKDEDDFIKNSSYYEDMKAEAMEDLQREIDEAYQKIKELERSNGE